MFKITPKTEIYKEKCDLYIKLVMVGNTSVGKSSLLERFAKNQFSENMIGTTGIDFRQKIVYIDNKVVKLEIWDIAG